MASKDQKKRGLIIVSNRLPLSLKKVDGGFESSLSSGGLVTALSGLTNSTTFKWFGWPGINIPDPEEQKRAAESLEQKGAKGIFLEEKLGHAHYNGFSSTSPNPSWQNRADVI
jgi:trehalose 6-phosphate synthase